MLSESMLSMLSDQYRHETINALKYAEAASWANARGFVNISAFFAKEAEGERGHAKRVAQYIDDRNAALIVAPFSYPDAIPVSDLPSLFQFAMLTEQGTTAALSEILINARMEGDFLTDAWLLGPEGLMLEQVEEENRYQTILDRIAQYPDCPSRAHDLDTWIGEAFA